MLAADYVGLATVITALGIAIPSIVGAVASLRTHKVATATKEAVTTGNGQTLADLAEADEGRRIQSDIPAGQRTPAEQSYVQNLTTPTESETESKP